MPTFGRKISANAAWSSFIARNTSSTRAVERIASDGVRDKGRERWSIPLKTAFMAIFIVMTVPVILALIQINYVSSDRVASDYAAGMVERFRNNAIKDIENEFADLKSRIGTAAVLGNHEPRLYEDDRIRSYLFSLLTHNETILSVYVGLEDGSFRQARRIHDPKVAIHGHLPPADAPYAYRTVTAQIDGRVLDRYLFMDKEMNPRGEVVAESDYDPRVRRWYRDAREAGRTIITDPELFWAFGLVGFTVAAPFEKNRALAGVVAADITLDSFSAYLARHPISPDSLTYLLDEDGRVLAASDQSAHYGSDNDQLRLPHITSVESEFVALAYTTRPRDMSDGVYQISHEGHDYVIGLSGFDQAFDKPWRLFVVTPFADFTGAFDHNNRQMLLIGAAAVLAQLIVIYALASLLASPLRKLASKVNHIRKLQRSDIGAITSPVTEISTLSRAVDTLDTAVRAFACFVPVSLVRQLLRSEGKLQLGGQSRFLTIFFSDVEGFSTMAEQMASRDLLARMSILLETVSKAVHEESGTIDKFVGDGVMAFWGAPAPLDEHAHHACIAALRIQHKLKTLNDQWLRTGAHLMRVRIGIHSDAVLVGNVGSNERMSYTVIGDGVNIASRLEAVNKTYGTLTCISHDTFREAGDRLCVRPIDEVTVKGRRARITIYELLGAYGSGRDLEPSLDTEQLARLTRQAHDALLRGDRDGALQHYRAALEVRPNDPVAWIHVQRLEAPKGPTAVDAIA